MSQCGHDPTRARTDYNRRSFPRRNSRKSRPDGTSALWLSAWVCKRIGLSSIRRIWNSPRRILERGRIPILPAAASRLVPQRLGPARRPVELRLPGCRALHALTVTYEGNRFLRMSRPNQAEFEQLDCLADDLRESYSERSYRVDSALALDAGFDTGDARSALERGLVLNSLAVGCGLLGVDFRTANGSGRELRFEGALVDRRYRVRRARRLADGEIVVHVSSDASLATNPDDPAELSLFDDAVVDDWAFLWLLAPDRRTIQEVLAAEVTGYTEGRPGRLKFGIVRALGTVQDPTPLGFRPAEEDLDLGDDDESDEGTIGGVGA